MFLCLWAAEVQPELEQPSAKQQKGMSCQVSRGFRAFFFFPEVWELWFVWHSF